MNEEASVSGTGRQWRHHPLPAAAGALGAGNGDEGLARSSEAGGEPAFAGRPGHRRRITTP